MRRLRCVHAIARKGLLAADTIHRVGRFEWRRRQTRDARSRGEPPRSPLLLLGADPRPLPTHLPIVLIGGKNHQSRGRVTPLPPSVLRLLLSLPLRPPRGSDGRIHFGADLLPPARLGLLKQREPGSFPLGVIPTRRGKRYLPRVNLEFVRVHSGRTGGERRRGRGAQRRSRVLLLLVVMRMMLVLVDEE